MDRSRQAGFTMTELVVVMTIVGILLGIGVPSYRYVTTSNRIATEVNGLLGDMQLARAEAIKQGLPVAACVSTTGTSCAGATANWHTGWIVFLDRNGSGTVDGAADTILKTQRAFPAGDTLVANPATGIVSFNREGFAVLGAALRITLHDSTANSQWTRCLAVTAIGKMEVQTHAAVAACL